MAVGIKRNALDFMVYWVTNCAHAEEYQRDGDESLARALEGRCLAMVADEGFTKM